MSLNVPNKHPFCNPKNDHRASSTFITPIQSNPSNGPQMSNPPDKLPMSDEEIAALKGSESFDEGDVLPGGFPVR